MGEKPKPRAAQPKPVHYVLIPEQSEAGRPMYEQLSELIDAHHDELSQANVRVALAWSLAWKPDIDGRLTLGKCKKATDLDRELAPYDFVILLNREFWENPHVTALQRTALLDHELHHAAVAYDEQGEPRVDERGRTVFRTRKHDLEEFSSIAERYGCWKRDIEDFMRALARAEKHASSGWIGFSSLSETLKTIGFEVPPTVIATWPEEERRDVLTWAQLRQGSDRVVVNAALSTTIPSCLAAALSPSADSTTH